jgi:hypothetical protein
VGASTCHESILGRMRELHRSLSGNRRVAAVWSATGLLLVEIFVEA